MSRKGVPNFAATPQDRELVKMCAAVGVSHEQMALMIERPDPEGLLHPISVDTLTRHFASELASGKSRIVVTIAGRLVRTALGSNEKAQVADELRAQMFFLKTQAGWRETVGIDLPSDDDDRDDTALAAAVAGLIEKGRRQAARRKSVAPAAGEKRTIQ
jgi:hypothetical protein